MGCDIHLYFERKNNENKWEPIEIDERLFPDDRNYELFGLLAGVRGSCEGYFPSRGIPKDTSMNEDHYLGDHSFTYAYLDELLNIDWGKWAYYFYFQTFCENILPRLCSYCGTLSKEEERSIRIVMGFDS